ncbi:putative membrane protein [Microbacterium sp. AG790]|uniref:TMEM175 family protein n=1 Tax=Microbacterium sp. AG790 TaxID=2183995 RepID=UPI000EAF17B6|nr:TMEM175 family protein [Microbacterium sp. AG790]RKS86766.1 putative membrane protein [Microbacterium sp. AG790]
MSEDQIDDGARNAVQGEKALDRLVAFSDAVVAIAITLVVLPLVDRAMDAESASAFFADNVTGMISAALSFVVIAAFWRANHVMFVHARGYSRLVSRLQTLWLATIVFLPVATALDLAGPGTDRVGLGAYIGTMLLGGVILRVQAIALQRAGLSDRAPAPPLTHWIGTILMALALALVLLFPQYGALWLLVLLLEIPLGPLLSRRPR